MVSLVVQLISQEELLDITGEAARILALSTYNNLLHASGLSTLRTKHA